MFAMKTLAFWQTNKDELYKDLSNPWSLLKGKLILEDVHLISLFSSEKTVGLSVFEVFRAPWMRLKQNQPPNHESN